MDEKNIFSETGQPALQYENVIMKESKLPVNVFFVQTILTVQDADFTGMRNWSFIM